MYRVRQEIAEDENAIRAVTIAAFEGSEFGHNGEADLGIRHGFAGLPQELLFLWTRAACYEEPLQNGSAHFDTAFGPQTDWQAQRNSTRSHWRGTAGWPP